MILIGLSQKQLVANKMSWNELKEEFVTCAEVKYGGNTAALLDSYIQEMC